MSMERRDGDVVITMSAADFDIMTLALGLAAGFLPAFERSIFALSNRIHEGDEAWIPLKIPAETAN